MFFQELCVSFTWMYVLQNILIRLTYLFYDSLLSSFSNKHQFSKFYFGVYNSWTLVGLQTGIKPLLCVGCQVRTPPKIMKTFIVLAASAIALASGLCLEDDEVVAMCTVGTPIGEERNMIQHWSCAWYCSFCLITKRPENLWLFKIFKGSKLEEAAALCENGSAEGRRKNSKSKGKGKGKGKGQKKCPTVEDVWNKVQEDMGGKKMLLFRFRFWIQIIMIQMSFVSSSRLAGWMRAMSLTMPLPWLTLLPCLRR